LNILAGAGGLLVCALWILSVATNGPFNFSSDQPAIQLFPWALFFCIVIFATLHRFIGGYSKNKGWHLSAGIVCLGVMAFTSRLVYVRTSENRSAAAERKQEHTVITDIPGQFSKLRADMSAKSENAIVQPDYIEGTRVTHSDLGYMFPYGYGIIYLNRDKRLKYEVFKTGKTEWVLDWDKVKIEPDVSKQIVHWSVPIVETKITKVPNGNAFKMVGGSISTDSTFKPGEYRRAGVYMESVPVMHVGTLSDNQLTPVFVIGFRIPLESERPQRSNRPDTK